MNDRPGLRRVNFERDYSRFGSATKNTGKIMRWWDRMDRTQQDLYGYRRFMVDYSEYRSDGSGEVEYDIWVDLYTRGGYLVQTICHRIGYEEYIGFIKRLEQQLEEKKNQGTYG